MQLSFFDIDVRAFTTDKGVTLPHPLLQEMEQRVRLAYDGDQAKPPPWEACDHKDPGTFKAGTFRDVDKRHCFGADAAMANWVGKETPLHYRA
jgi:hypothetical protein